MVGIFHGYVSHNQMIINMATDLGCKYGSWIHMVLPVEKSSTSKKESQGIETNNLGWIKRIKRKLDIGPTVPHVKGQKSGYEPSKSQSAREARGRGRKEVSGTGAARYELRNPCSWLIRRKIHYQKTQRNNAGKTNFIDSLTHIFCSQSSVRLCAVVCLSHPWKFSAATHVHHTRYSTNVVIPIFRVSYYLRVVYIPI